jgi:transposase
VFTGVIGLPAGTRIWIAAGVTDLRRGFTGLSGMVQTALQENPFSGHVFVFRGRRGDLIKVHGSMVTGCVCSRKDWNEADSSGLKQPAELWP